MPPTTPDRTAGTPPARLAAATKRYGDVEALAGLDLTVRGGEILALLGPNGAGKTTTVHLLLGLTRPSSGAVEIFGRRPDHPRSRMRVGAMLQISRVPDTLRVAELVELFSSYYPTPLALAESLAVAGLERLAARPFGELSGGQRQRLLFALAICGDPDLLFLDEPTAGLDVDARRALWQQIRGLAARGRSVVLTTHHLEEADSLADRVVVIDRGRLVAAGSPQEIKSRVRSRRVRCRTRLSESELRALPGVADLRLEGGVAELLVGRAEPVVRALLARDAGLTDLEVRGAALEEAFLALTRDAEEEAA